jgi:hypothetical protein
MADGVTIIVVAGQHSYSGLLDNRGSRVSDLLNDPGTQFLQLSKVTLHQKFFERVVESLPEVTIPKQGIDFVLLEQGKHEAPLRRQNARIDKRSFTAVVVLNDYEIRGTLMLKGVPDEVAALSRELAAFFPVTNTRLSMPTGAAAPTPAGIALVNKARVTLLHIDSLRPPSGKTAI